MAAELKAELDAVEGRVPRYLYKTFSGEFNSSDPVRGFRPPSQTYSERLSDLEFEATKSMLRNHDLGKSAPGGHHPSSQFVSWTSSLLFALQLAVCDEVHGDRNVQIVVLDTSKIETHSFFAAADLLRIYQVTPVRELTERLFVSDYLYYGGLMVHGSSNTVSLNLLSEYGLFKILPELLNREAQPSIHKMVRDIRFTMFSLPRLVTPTECLIALQIASLFGKDFSTPICVALLSMRRRAAEDKLFLKLAIDYADPSQDFTTGFSSSSDDIALAPELENFIVLMDCANQESVRLKPGGPDEMAEFRCAFDALSVSCDELAIALEQALTTVLKPSVLLQCSTAIQTARRIFHEKWAAEVGSRRSKPEVSRPMRFPVRLPPPLLL